MQFQLPPAKKKTAVFNGTSTLFLLHPRKLQVCFLSRNVFFPDSMSAFRGVLTFVTSVCLPEGIFFSNLVFLWCFQQPQPQPACDFLFFRYYQALFSPLQSRTPPQVSPKTNPVQHPAGRGQRRCFSNPSSRVVLLNATSLTSDLEIFE